MLLDLEKNFIARAEQKSLDKEGQENLELNLAKYIQKKVQSRAMYTNIGLARDRVLYARTNGMSNLEKYLKEFELKFTERGGKIVWVFDEEEAILAIARILKEVEAKKIITTHSAAIEEIAVKEKLQENYSITETALQDYMNALAEDGDFELIRKENGDTARFLEKTFQIKFDPAPNSIRNFIRGNMRAFFLDADVAITGANFLIADVGAIALSENEGNIARACAFPKTHIVVAGYEKIIPSIHNMELLWTMFSSSGNGSIISAYNHLIFGARNEYESDGPEGIHLILLNNGRDKVLREYYQRKALNCIRCGSCARHCPVWKTVGEKAYGAPYTGPIGSVLVPLMKNSITYRYLTNASALHEEPARYCPARVPLNELLLYNRALFAREKRNGVSIGEDLWMNHSAILLKNRWLMNIPTVYKKFILAFLLKGNWKTHGIMPKFAEKSFNAIYRTLPKNK